MIPIDILHGLKSITHPSRTSVYTFIMEVTPPLPWGEVMEEIMVIIAFIGIWYIRPLSLILFSLFPPWSLLEKYCYWSQKYNFMHKTSLLMCSYYKTYGNIKLTKNVHKGVISQVDNMNVTLYNIKRNLCYIIFHRDQYFTCFDEYYHTSDNAPMSFY